MCLIRYVVDAIRSAPNLILFLYIAGKVISAMGIAFIIAIFVEKREYFTVGVFLLIIGILISVPVIKYIYKFNKKIQK